MKHNYASSELKFSVRKAGFTARSTGFVNAGRLALRLPATNRRSVAKLSRHCSGLFQREGVHLFYFRRKVSCCPPMSYHSNSDVDSSSLIETFSVRP
jgi:hypothetical protein